MAARGAISGGGGSPASPSAARSRRSAGGSVTAPTIRRGPAQRGHTSTSTANTRCKSVAQEGRPGDRGRFVSGAASAWAGGCGTIAARHAACGPEDTVGGQQRAAGRGDERGEALEELQGVQQQLKGTLIQDHKGVSPPGPQPGQPGPEEAITPAQRGPARRPPVHGELLAQGEVLEGELAVAAAEGWDESKQVEQRADHGKAIVSGSEPKDQPLVRRTGFWRRTGQGVGGVPVSGRRRRGVEPPRDWLGVGNASPHRARPCRPEHGRGPAPPHGSDSSLRPGLPVHVGRLRQAAVRRPGSGR
jgi:hypothetical protein